MKNKSIIAEIVKKITENYDPEKIILFGSYATGNQTDASDLDFVIVKTPTFQNTNAVEKSEGFLSGR